MADADHWRDRGREQHLDRHPDVHQQPGQVAWLLNRLHHLYQRQQQRHQLHVDDSCCHRHRGCPGHGADLHSHPDVCGLWRDSEGFVFRQHHLHQRQRQRDQLHPDVSGPGRHGSHNQFCRRADQQDHQRPGQHDQQRQLDRRRHGHASGRQRRHGRCNLDRDRQGQRHRRLLRGCRRNRLRHANRL